MGSLQTELQKVVGNKAIPPWTENGPDNPNESGAAQQGADRPHTGRSNTEKIYSSVQSYPGRTASFYEKHLESEGVPRSSVSSFLHQLERRGYLRHEGERPAKFYVTEQKYSPAVADEKRRVKISAARKARAALAAKRKAAREKFKGQNEKLVESTKNTLATVRENAKTTEN